MKRYLKEFIILILQLMIFYLLPLTAGPTDTMGLIFLIIISVFVLALVLGLISDKKAKYAYPAVISVLFIPSIFIYYNESAFIHCVWYLVISILGVIIGSIVKRIYKSIKKK